MKKLPIATALILVGAWCVAGCGDGGTENGNGDDTPPVIELVTPADGAEGVSVTTKVWVEFSEAMGADSTEAAFSLDSDAGTVAGSFTWADENMVFSPDDPLIADELYTVRVGTGAADTYGNQLEDAFESTFRTGIVIGVASVSPEDGAIDAPTSTVIDVTFSNEMDTASVEGAFVLENDAGPVSGTFAWTDSTATFTPDALLLNATVYVVSVDRAAEDVDGNHLPETFSSTFTTGMVAPEVTGDIVASAPTWTWSASADCTGYRYQLDGEDGEWTEVEAAVTTYTPDPPPADGDHTLYVQARYNADDWSASGSFTTTVGAVVDGDLVIATQADLENFTYLAVTGDLKVENTDLVDLTGIESLKRVEGNVIISRNEYLETLNGLNNLFSIGGDLRLVQNYSLTTPVGLEGLVTIGGTLRLQESYITNFTGLSSLTTIEGGLSVTMSFSFSNFTGLGSLTTIGGSLGILESSVDDFTGLEGVTSLGGLFISGTGVDSLTGLGNVASLGRLSLNQVSIPTLAGLDALTTIDGDVELTELRTVTDLTGFENITSIGGKFELEDCSFTSLSGLEALTHVEGSLRFFFVYMTDMNGLNQLESIGGSLSFSECEVMESMDGLEALASIGGNLSINYNFILASLAGLRGLESLGGHLTVKDNNALPTCEAEGLRGQLLDHGWTGTADISDNNDAGTCD